MFAESTALSNFALVVLVTLTMFHTRRYMDTVAQGNLKKEDDLAFTVNRDVGLLLSMNAPYYGPPDCTLSIRKIEYLGLGMGPMDRIISVECYGHQQLHQLKKTIGKTLGRTIEYFELDGNRLPEKLDCKHLEGVVLDPNFHGCPMGDKYNRSRWCMRTLQKVDPIWKAKSHPDRKSCLIMTGLKPRMKPMSWTGRSDWLGCSPTPPARTME
jgi:hypothetical protein